MSTELNRVTSDSRSGLLQLQLHVVELFFGSGADRDVHVGHPISTGPVHHARCCRRLRREHECTPWKQVKHFCNIHSTCALHLASGGWASHSSWVSPEISSHWAVFFATVTGFFIPPASLTSCTCYLGAQAWCLPFFALSLLCTAFL